MENLSTELREFVFDERTGPGLTMKYLVHEWLSFCGLLYEYHGHIMTLKNWKIGPSEVHATSGANLGRPLYLVTFFLLLIFLTL